MAVGDAHVFPGFLTPVLTQLFFPKRPTTFLTCFCRGERRIYVGKKSPLNQGSNSQPPGHESDTLSTEPPGQGCFGKGRKHYGKRRKCWLPAFSPFPIMFSKGFSYWVIKSRDCVIKSWVIKSRDCVIKS